MDDYDRDAAGERPSDPRFSTYAEKNAEVGTPEAAANDPDLRTAKRMVARLHLDARDLQQGSHLSDEHLADTIIEAADLIERLIARLR